MRDAYHLPPTTDPKNRKIDPEMAKEARIGSGVSDGSIYDFDVPHRGASFSIYLTIIIMAVVTLLLLSLLFRIF